MKKQDNKKPEEQEIVEEVVEKTNQNEVEEWKNKYMRALADYQNLERRTREEKQEIRQYAGEVLLGRLLPVVDTFEKVSVHLNDTGVSLALKQLSAFLAEQGVQKLDVLGKPFDPHHMECIEVVDGEDDRVVEEVMPGYTFHGKVLRVAQVKVGKESKN